MPDLQSPSDGSQPTVQQVEVLIARAQHLIDSRPRGEYPLTWCIEAFYIGDLTAIAAVAARASDAAPT